MPLYVGSSMLFVLPKLINALTGQDVPHDATVTVMLQDQAGDEIAGQTWPQAMTYGDYWDGHALRQGWRCTLDHDLVIVPGQHVDADVAVDLGVLGTGHWRVELEVVELR